MVLLFLDFSDIKTQQWSTDIQEVSPVNDFDEYKDQQGMCERW